MVSSLVIRVYIVPRPLVGTLLGLGRRKVPVLHRRSLWRRSRCPAGTGEGYKRDGYYEVPVSHVNDHQSQPRPIDLGERSRWLRIGLIRGYQGRWFST